MGDVFRPLVEVVGNVNTAGHASRLALDLRFLGGDRNETSDRLPTAAQNDLFATLGHAHDWHYTNARAGRRRAAGYSQPPVPSLAEASLTDDERRVVERLVDLVRERFGDRLRSVWLYGSRARGERPGPESDVDLLAIADRGERDDDDGLAAILLVDQAAEELRLPRPIVSIKVYDPGWLEGRRAIDSFFIREVDRDKVVLYGEP